MNNNRDSIDAAEHIVVINSKIDFLKSLYNWADKPEDIVM